MWIKRVIDRRYGMLRDRVMLRVAFVREEFFSFRAAVRARWVRWTSIRTWVPFVRGVCAMRPATLRRHLMYASVASIAAVIIAAGVIYASAVARDRLVAKLEAIERRAVADANYGDAINTLRWLARLEPSEPKYSLRLADALQKNGQMTGSNELIEQLAPLYGHGYGPAYLFRASRRDGRRRVARAT